MLTNYADVKAYLNLTTDNDQALIIRLIGAASNFLQTYLNRNLESATYAETRNGTGNNRMMLFNDPVTLVSSVTVNNQVILPAVDSVSSGYIITDSMLHLRWYLFTRGIQNVVVVYTAGYSISPDMIPDGIQQVCVDLVALKYKERDRIGENNKTFGGVTVSYRTWDLTKGQQGMLNQYQRRTPMPI